MALPSLPVQGQNPWYIPRTAWDNAVKAELEGRLSNSTLDQRYSRNAVNDITLFGAVSTPGVDNTTAIQSAIANSISTGKPLYVPPGVYEAVNLVVIGASNFQVHMDGTIKRPNNSIRASIITFKDCTNTTFGTIRTDGNVSNNLFEGYPVDEAKHDIRIENVTGFVGVETYSRNPAGDGIYIAGGSANNSSKIYIGQVYSRSDANTGRNALSIIKGYDMVFDSVTSIDTGYPGNVSPSRIAMPGGFDIEPNSAADLVNNIVVGSVFAKSAGSTGFCIFSTFGKVITNVTIGNVISERTSAALAGTNGFVIRGAKNVKIASLIHNGGGYAASGASIDDSENVTIAADIYNVSNAGLTIGASANVTNLRYRGTIDGSTGHGITVYALTNSEFDVVVRNQGTSHACLSKIASGASSNVVFRGSFAKGTKGALMTSIAATVSNWVLDRVDCTGWGVDTRLKGTFASDLLTKECLGVNYADATPNFDAWKAGTKIEKLTYAASTSPGWIATSNGIGSAANWKTMAPLGA